MKTLRALAEERHQKTSLMEGVVKKAEQEGRDLKPEERVRFDRLDRQVRQLDGEIAKLEEQANRDDPGRAERQRQLRSAVVEPGSHRAGGEP